MKTDTLDDLRMIEEAIACTESALHYVDHMTASRNRDACLRRLELTLQSLEKQRTAFCKTWGISDSDGAFE